MKRAALAIGLGVATLLYGLYLHFAWTQQRLQKRAEGVAHAAARAAATGDPVGPRVQRYLSLVRKDIAPPLVEWPPRSGRHAGNRDAVRVTLQGRWRPPLLRAVLSWSYPIEVRATVIAMPRDSSGRRSVSRVE